MEIKEFIKNIRGFCFRAPKMRKIVSRITGYSFVGRAESLERSVDSHGGVYHILCALLAQKAEDGLRFVQVGANDGLNDDPIHTFVHRYGSEILLVEPQPWLIESLKENYSDFKGSVIIENCACGSADGILKLYHLKQKYWEQYEKNVGRRADQLVSTCSEQILNRIVPRLNIVEADANDYIEAIDVPALRIDALLNKHGIVDFDVLQIDAEGHDMEVLEGLNSVRPTIINMEYFNLSLDEIKRFETWCEVNSYQIVWRGKDALAVRMETLISV